MTALVFRNVDASPDDPVSGWPHEAIQAALERGGLEHWRRLADAIQAEPWGPIARRVEQVLAYSRPYGVAMAMERVIARSRDAAEASERETVAAEVDALVRASGLSQAEFASRIGTSPSRLSTYVTGKVTPSAALLVRMRRASAAPHNEDTPSPPSGASPACSASPTVRRGPQDGPRPPRAQPLGQARRGRRGGRAGD